MTDRRAFIKTGAAGLAGILAARRAPAFGQTPRVHLLYRVDFIPQGEAELKRQLTEYVKQMKIDISFETINENDLQARITAAIQSGSGADVVQMLHNWPQLYASALVDMNDLCEWKEKDQGKFYPQSEAAARSGNRWLALPHAITPALIAYRKSWFAEVGAPEPPRTLEEYRRIGRSRKRAGRPARPWATRSMTRRPGPIPSPGPSVAPRPTRRGRRSCSTPKAPSRP
jgi:multiple sugar transport system substrate-binding protein